jgi:hypothetical protein
MREFFKQKETKVAKNAFGSSERKDSLCTESQPLMDTNENQLSGLVSIGVDSWLVYFGAREATRLRRGYGAVRRGIDYLGASESTIFSKRGSPRSGSQNGSSFSQP